MRSFTIHINFLKVSRKISAVCNDYRALGMICNDRRVQGSILVGIQGAKPPETSEIWHFEVHNPQKLNFNFTFHGKIVIQKSC